MFLMAPLFSPILSSTAPIWLFVLNPNWEVACPWICTRHRVTERTRSIVWKSVWHKVDEKLAVANCVVLNRLMTLTRDQIDMHVGQRTQNITLGLISDYMHLRHDNSSCFKILWQDVCGKARDSLCLGLEIWGKRWYKMVYLDCLAIRGCSLTKDCWSSKSINRPKGMSWNNFAMVEHQHQQSTDAATKWMTLHKRSRY